MRKSLINNNIIYCVYHEIQNEERSREILEILESIGKVTLISFSKFDKKYNVKQIITSGGKLKYLNFIIKSILTFINNKNTEIIVLHDNYTSILIPFAKIIFYKKIIIFDSSELYPLFEIRKRFKIYQFSFFKELFLSLNERIFLKYCNLIIAANKYRAIAMHKYYKLKKLPFVFDNVHQIKNEYNYNYCMQKYKSIIDKSKYIFVYAGGIYYDRDTIEIAKAFIENGEKYRLIICGKYGKKEKEELDDIISNNKAKNIYYIGFISREELKYLYENCHVGISAFKKNTINNKYCASGKIYECLFCKKPILCSDNLPFKELCNKYKVGIATKNYAIGINSIINNYEYYQANAKKFADEYNNQNKKEELKKMIYYEIMKDNI
jgi:hypothetical protein